MTVVTPACAKEPHANFPDTNVYVQEVDSDFGFVKAHLYFLPKEQHKYHLVLLVAV